MQGQQEAPARSVVAWPVTATIITLRLVRHAVRTASDEGHLVWLEEGRGLLERELRVRGDQAGVERARAIMLEQLL